MSCHFLGLPLKNGQNGQGFVEAVLILALIAVVAITILGGYGFTLCRHFAGAFGNSWDAFQDTFGLSEGSPGYNALYDFNRDGTVDGDDLGAAGTGKLYNCREHRFMN